VNRGIVNSNLSEKARGEGAAQADALTMDGIHARYFFVTEEGTSFSSSGLDPETYLVVEQSYRAVRLISLAQKW